MRGKKEKSFVRGMASIAIGLSATVLIITWCLFSIKAKVGNEEADKEPDKVHYYIHKDDKSDLTIDSTKKDDMVDKVTSTDKDFIDDWRIILVNADNPIPDGYTPELSSIDGIRLFDARAVDNLKSLIEGCREQTGASIWAQSTYRDENAQEAIYNAEVKKYTDRGKSEDEAERLTSLTVATPGTSEHETGLAVDFNCVNYEFEDGQAFKWLMENSQEYGFILRYPKDKEAITKISYEPWHFRYVGKDHARIMKANNFCLEEYIDYLKKTE